MQALLDAVDAVDLVTLAFPLYVDSLPAPVIEALERIAAHRQGRDQSHRQLFAAISNCGFPEAHHNANALAICENFSWQAGFEWAGALSLGAGEMVAGKPLAGAGGAAIPLRKVLDLAADALAQGQAIPKPARDALARPIIPHWVYRLLGGLRWKLYNRRHSHCENYSGTPARLLGTIIFLFGVGVTLYSVSEWLQPGVAGDFLTGLVRSPQGWESFLSHLVTSRCYSGWSV